MENLADSVQMQPGLQDAPLIVNEDSPMPQRHVKFIIKKSVNTTKVNAEASDDNSIEKSPSNVELQDKELLQNQSNHEDTTPLTKKELSESPRPLKMCRKRALYKAVVDGEDNNDESIVNASNQLVLYNPNTSNMTQDIIPIPDHDESYTTALHKMMVTNPTSRILPSVGAYTVQCASCFKWRFIPNKEKYEQIREHILESPFMCMQARAWRPDITCDDPADIVQDGSRLWAIDKPNIAQPPPGWVRELRIRGEGSSKFADVYYAAPSGKKLRSMVEVQKYLVEHPEYTEQGVKLSQFSFQTPRPLQENYVRKRPSRVSNPADGSLGLSRPLEPEDVNPLSWVEPTEEDIHRGQAFQTPPSSESPLHSQLYKKKKKRSHNPNIYIPDNSNNDSFNPVLQSSPIEEL